MARIKTLQELFRRYRRPGDIVFASLFLLFSVFLLTQIPAETAWTKRTQWFAQPRLWPSIGIGGMVLFSALHFIGSLCSERIPGRWREVGFWLKSLEYVAYFLIYVVLVPQIGYLPATLAFTIFLTFRVGEATPLNLAAAAVFSVAVVLIFRAFLQVKIPAGRIYEALPDGIRAFAQIYL
ncbi:tripartite tricarboxylate transporter TctB family protein [Roseibium sp. M-1]